MAEFKIYKLHFTTPLHLGDNRDDYSVSLKTIQSDTMYAAITSCLAKLGVKIPDNGDLGCSISSLFPFYQKEEKGAAVYFLPKPLKQKLPKLENVDNAKKIKKVSWLDVNYFERILKGGTLFENEKEISAIKKSYLTDQAIDEDFISSEVSPRVKIPRSPEDGEGDQKGKSVPFYMDRVYFKDYSGLYFMVKGNTTLLDKAMNLLQYEGIGTDRNVGNGYFTFENNKTISIEIPKESSFVMSLSMFIPETEKQLQELINDDNVAYDFTRRGGWITTPPHNTIRKNVIHAFLPASVFKKNLSDATVVGKIVDLKPEIDPKIEHPIYRCGKSIFIPIKL